MATEIQTYRNIKAHDYRGTDYRNIKAHDYRGTRL